MGLYGHRASIINQFDEMATADYISADKLSTWSMATGIAGIIVFPGIAHIVAVITGALALQRAKRLQTMQVSIIKSKARTGLIFGVFGLVCVVLGLAVSMAFLGASLLIIGSSAGAV